MPTKYKDYPVYTYDEPATYSDFSGGINTDPSNEHLKDNELRNALNVQYRSSALVKRNGAKVLSSFNIEDAVTNIQGVFLFTVKLTYLIVAADGKLYSGIYNGPNSTSNLTRLRILIDDEDSSSKEVYNPKDQSAGLEEKFNLEEDNLYHDGFVYSYLKTYDALTKKYIDEEINYVGDMQYFTNTLLQKNDIFSYSAVKYRVKKPLQIYSTQPNIEGSSFWEEISKPSNTNNINSWNGYDSYMINDIVYHIDYDNKLKYYKCIKAVNFMWNFNPISSNNKSDFIEEIKISKELIFQNYKQIESATYDNKLYITTGTRLIEVYLNSGELVAHPVKPHLCNNSEITNIGYNCLSPYPELCRETQYETVTTSIGIVLTIPLIGGQYELRPIMNFQMGEDENDYLYRWEKKINGTWYVIKPFKNQIIYNVENGQVIKKTTPVPSITVPDANIYQYRVTFAQSFETTTELTFSWNKDFSYSQNDLIEYNGNIYKCLISHTQSIDIPNEETFIGTKEIKFTETYEEVKENGTKETKQRDIYKIYWELVSEMEELNFFDEKKNGSEKYYKDTDYIVNKVTGSYFGQATSVQVNKLTPSDTYNIIQSCTKIHIDGNKFLLYGDNYNSGQWFKTIIGDPSYITNRGGLSFKTTKNEEVVKVIGFQGNIIVFANTKNLGGSIHLVTGNGDDYNSGSDQYYSPYKRVTKSTTITCDNANTIQVCDNLLVFKYLDTVYSLNSSSLSDEVFTFNTCNDRLKHSGSDVIIPWDDNDCVSIVTDDYYGIIWKEKYSLLDDEIVQERPAILLKMYYKISNAIDNKYYYPWLRDESQYFNTDHIIYISGSPIFVYKNSLITFADDTIKTDIGKVYPVMLKLKAYNCGYANMWKLLTSVQLMFHRTASSAVEINCVIRNEGKHLLLSNISSNKRTQNLRTLFVGNSVGKARLGSTTVESILLNTEYKFPYMLADAEITTYNDKDFSLSNITYFYTTIETPDINPYDLYSSVIRKKGE